MKFKTLIPLSLFCALILSACDDGDDPAPAAALAAPGEPTLAASGDTITVTWTAVSGATGYEVHRHTANDSSASMKIGDRVTGISFTDDDSDLRSNTTYYYWVKSCNAPTTCSALGAGKSLRATLTRTYRVKIINIMAGGTMAGPPPTPLGQVLSPPVAIIHNTGWAAFELGQAATVDLERIAEGGNPEQLLTSLGTEARILKFASTSLVPSNPGVVLPGADASLDLDFEPSGDGEHLTVLTMLARTNDGFTAINGVDLSDLAPGETRVLHGLAWDAGTEANDESAATLIADAQGTNGFDAARTDVADTVSLHPGVTTAHDTVSAAIDAGTMKPVSILTHLDKFDNPVMRVEVTRMAPSSGSGS